jgi:uncharacterized protein (TIGR02266 family)
MIRILLVDDARLFLELERSFLRRTGCEVSIATSGEEALRKARGRRPHIVVLDATMPGMSGIECCRALKADPETRDVTVILVSSSLDYPECRKAGADGFVLRPVTRSGLMEAIRDHVELSERGHQRVRVGLEVAYRHGERLGTGMTKDLGAGGLFLRTRDRLEPGDTLALSIAVPEADLEKIEVRGRVVRTVRAHADSPLVPGVGVEFEGLRGGARRAISRIVGEAEARSS